MKVDRKASAGLTVIEMLMALALAAILLTVAVPSFLSSIRANQVLTKTDMLVSTLSLARSEAAKRNMQVSVCQSSDLVSCNTAAAWQQGWIVFVDSDADGTLDAGDDELLQKYSSLPSGYTLKASENFANGLAYLSTGALAEGGNVSDGFRLCGPDQSTTNGRTVFVNATGRPRVSKGVTAC